MSFANLFGGFILLYLSATGILENNARVENITQIGYIVGLIGISASAWIYTLSSVDSHNS